MDLIGSSASKQQSLASVPRVKETVGMSRRLQCACHESERFLCGNEYCHLLTLMLLLVWNFVYGLSPCMLAILVAFSVSLNRAKHCNRKAYLMPCRRVGRTRVPMVRKRRCRNRKSLKITSFVACYNLCFSIFFERGNIRTSLSSVFTHGLASMQLMLEHIFLVVHLSMFCLFTFCVWHISKHMRNRLMHALCGNGKNQGRGQNTGRQNLKGKGRGKHAQEPSQPSNPLTTLQVEQQILQDAAERQYKAKVREALPEAAWIKNAAVLVPGEWKARACHPHELTAAGGVSYVGKELVPDVLRRIGYTQAPCAIVTTQPAKELGIPYPSVDVRCSLEVSNQEGSREIVEVNKFLTQIGYGSPVELATTGPCIVAPRTMHKCVARFDLPTGLQEGELTGRIVAEAVSKHINPAYFVDVNARQDNTATLMVQDVAVHDLLRASGQDHVYFRLHSTDPDADTLEIIWLPEQIPHSDALQLVAKEKTFGLALKRGANGPRYGLRFNTTEAMNAYAVKYSMGEKHKWGRFRASNIPSSVGLRGLHDMLSPLGWTIEEIEFFGDTGAVFLASGRGEHDQMHFVDHNKRKIPVMIKALNSRAREMTKDHAQAAAAEAKTAPKPAASASGNERAQVQKALFTKRSDPGKTGETPPPKQAKPGDHTQS